MKIAIGNDHTGVEMKKTIIVFLEDKGHEVINVGTDSDDAFPYAVSAYRASRLVADGEADCGILICGTGIGISMAANKVNGIRACACSDSLTAQLSKQHNNSNILAFGARIVGIETAKDIVTKWLEAEFEGGRHKPRIDMVTEIEKTQSLDTSGY